MAPPSLFVQNWSSPDFPSLSIISSASHWKSDHALPVYASIVSVALLLIHAFTLSEYTRPILVRLNLAKEREISPQVDSGGHIKSHGGRVIFATEVLTLIGSLELLRVSVTRVLALEGLERDAYSSLLALFAVVSPRPTIVSHHINLVLAASWTIFFARDVVPLLTYTRTPADPSHLLWHLISVLSLTAVVLPLVKPRRYVPFDPSDPMPPSPEQTASRLSLLFFAFQDATVWKAYRGPHLPLAELPPLADADHSKHLVRAALPHFDPYAERNDASGVRKQPQRHLFLAVASVFRPQIIVATLLLLSDNAATLLAPYALKKLLEYLANRDAATVNPWVWVASLFVGPLSSAIIKQQYQTLLGHSTVRLEAILTQLILKHALRIRIVAEVDSLAIAPTPPAAPSVAPSQSTSSSDESLTPPAESESDETVADEPQSKAASPSPPPSPPPPPPPPPQSKGKSLVGRMNNLISSDLQALARAAEFLQVFFGAPVMIVLTIGFLYNLLGWSALIGFVVLVAQTPLPIVFSRLLQGATKEVAKRSDDRVETVTETTSVIRMVKMFGWEKKMSERIDEKREAELTWVWWSKFYTLITMIFQFRALPFSFAYFLTRLVSYLLPALTMIATFTVYALAMKRSLDAATVFSSIALFNILRTKVAMLFMWLPNVLKGNVSLQRISDFLYETELLDKFSDNAVAHGENGINDIGFRAATFSWAREDANEGARTPSKRSFRLEIKDELLFKRGSINLIVGPTGSGKTSLLMALLGEMHFLPSGPGAWFNLPRTGGVAYAAQESWVLNAMIKENIIFGAPFDEERYKKVLDQCALLRDLELLDAGDLTEVGEKGLTLSGGQKARLTLARAVYSSAEIIILDDVLAALDVHTAKWIVDKCLVGDLVRGRTVILVTHNVSIAAPVSDFVVSLGPDGHILSQGRISDALAKNAKLELQVVEEKVAEDKAEQEVVQQTDAPKKENKGKLIVEEETSKGHLSWESSK
ncbi:hypothetical protein DXG03_007916 [Asterophora parasitica]|uniref:P-loop containing nucleoside triphosphate hydrolase protein n=1 Tax=Asterophora parasitica TaxID=117018 RepID=A0A9P7G6Z9_9AGAR|nr:hypothetical protein DXG03_007916 [Asterophora parasitica]